MRAWPNTQNHCKVLRFRTRNSHHLPRIITTRPPFSPNRMRKRCKGCHFARATERHRTEMTQMRQGPSPGPQPPDPPFRSRGIAKPGPGGRGWVTGLHQPPPSLVQLNAIATNQKHSTRMIHKLTTPARWGRRTSPAYGSCRRPLKKALTNMRCKKHALAQARASFFKRCALAYTRAPFRTPGPEAPDRPWRL